MSHTDPSLEKEADKDLAKAATLSSSAYLFGWFVIVYTTNVVGELPLVSMIGTMMLVLAFVARFVLGVGFDMLYGRLPYPRWQYAYGATVVVNAGTWGALNAILAWHYFPSWPAYLISFCTAGLAAGAMTALSTHLKMSGASVTLVIVPSLVTFMVIGGTEGTVFGFLYLVYYLIMMGIGRQLNLRYWAVLRGSHQLKIALHKAEAANRAKSQFLANMSHEIRTPLNAVLGFAQIGRRRSHDPDAKYRYSHILASGQHLLAIINEILDLSQLEAGKLGVDATPFKLTANVNEALGFVRGSAQEKGLNLSVEYDPELPDWVIGDPLRLRQILANLLGNAVKFTLEGEIRLTVQPVNGQVCFSVIDTGIGIDDTQISRLFNTFEQADGTNSRRFGGTGLGLAISLNLATLMGGTITAESVLGQGSTFTLCLPLKKTRQSEHFSGRETQPAGVRLAGLRVLAVEDDESNRLVLREMLEYEGATLVIAKNGQQALDCLENPDSIAFDIVIMDVQMPEMDGYEATRRIHSIAPGLPVIGLTAHAMDEERERCLDAGMATHVTKPIDVNDLVDILLQQLPKTNKHENPETPIMAQPALAAEKPQQDLLPGFAIDKTLENLKCDLPTFKGILLSYYKQRRTNGKEIATLLTRGDVDEARELLHGIIGSSGYLGAWRLYQEARVLEEACKTGDMDFAMEQLPQFCLSFDEVIKGLEELDKEGTTNQSKAP